VGDESAYPRPWASTADTNAIAPTALYGDALSAAGFEILSERECRGLCLIVRVIVVAPDAGAMAALTGGRAPNPGSSFLEAVGRRGDTDTQGRESWRPADRSRNETQVYLKPEISYQHRPDNSSDSAVARR